MLSMKNEIEKIWDDVLVKLEQEHDVSSAAINAWIKPLHIKDVQFLWMLNMMSGVFNLLRKKCTIFIFPLLFPILPARNTI